MFMEHYAPKGRFAYAVAKERVRDYRYKGIIAKATTHIEPEEGENANALPV